MGHIGDHQISAADAVDVARVNALDRDLSGVHWFAVCGGHRGKPGGLADLSLVGHDLRPVGVEHRRTCQVHGDGPLARFHGHDPQLIAGAVLRSGFSV